MGASARPARPERSGVIRHPFSDFIMSVRLPEGFNRPVIDKYDGASDAVEHLAAFNAHMLLYGDAATDAIMCRAFAATLTKNPLRWFFTLPPKSITSFSDLSAKFLQQFAPTEEAPIATPSVTPTETPTETPSVLCKFKQGNNESLREYTRRFSQAAMQIEDLDLNFSVRVFAEGLKPCRLADSLINEPPQSLSEFLQTATYYMEEEEKMEEEQEEEDDGDEDEEEEEDEEYEPTRSYKRRNTNP